MNPKENFIRKSNLNEVRREFYEKLESLDNEVETKSQALDNYEQKIEDIVNKEFEKQFEPKLSQQAKFMETKERTVAKRKVGSSLRVHGLPEDVNKKEDDNLLQKNGTLNENMHGLGLYTKIESVQRLGKFATTRKKPKIVLVKLEN